MRLTFDNEFHFFSVFWREIRINTKAGKLIWVYATQDQFVNPVIFMGARARHSHDALVVIIDDTYTTTELRVIAQELRAFYLWTVARRAKKNLEETQHELAAAINLEKSRLKEVTKEIERLEECIQVQYEEFEGGYSDEDAHSAIPYSGLNLAPTMDTTTLYRKLLVEKRAAYYAEKRAEEYRASVWAEIAIAAVAAVAPGAA